MPPSLPPALRTLVDASRAIARQSATARVAVARMADLVDPDGLPPELRDDVVAELDAARAAACVPLGRKEIEAELKSSWGKPASKVLDDLDPDPIAVRPVSQVHRGEADGEPVAVRVRRPGLERATRNDLALLDGLIGPLRAAFPAADVAPLLRAGREQALDELDFEAEASTQRAVARVLRGVDGIVVPRALSELAAPGVLVTTLLDGDHEISDRQRTARALVEAFTAAAQAGWAVMDARPGHLLELNDGRLGLLGAGVARKVDPARVGLALDALAAARDDDEVAFVAAVEQAEVLGGDDARTALRLARKAGGPLLRGPATLDGPALHDLGARAAGQVGTAFGLATRGSIVPDDLWLARAAGQLVATLAQLGVEEDWPRLVLDSA